VLRVDIIGCASHAPPEERRYRRLLGSSRKIGSWHLGQQLHVEVKGCTGATPRFFLSRTEQRTADSDPSWRLAVITHALDAQQEFENLTDLPRWITQDLIGCAKLRNR
jgi:hypothetical protein